MHGLIDYGFGVVNSVGPALLGLKGSAAAIPAVAALAHGGLNAFTDQPYAVKRTIPFQGHHLAESVGVPALLVATLVSGATKQPRAKLFFGGLFLALGTVYALTDWDATPE
jgi:hypothetical protein